jgi:hypothetical protein
MGLSSGQSTAALENTYHRASGGSGRLGRDIGPGNHPAPQRGLQQLQGRGQPWHGSKVELLPVFQPNVRCTTSAGHLGVRAFYSWRGSCSCPFLSQCLSKKNACWERPGLACDLTVTLLQALHSVDRYGPFWKQLLLHCRKGPQLWNKSREGRLKMLKGRGDMI